jgi:hypothetical protein
MPTNVYSVNNRRALTTADLPKQEILYGEDAPTVEMYRPILAGPDDPSYTAAEALEQIPLTLMPNKLALGWTSNLPSVAVTGTAVAGGVTEAAIAAGGETLIFTLTNGTWIDDILVELEDGTSLNGSASGAGSFDTEVYAVIDWTTDAVRTSDTVVTLTLPAAAGYSIAGDETVTHQGLRYRFVKINGVALTGYVSSPGMTASPTTFTITNA